MQSLMFDAVKAAESAAESFAEDPLMVRNVVHAAAILNPHSGRDDAQLWYDRYKDRFDECTPAARYGLAFKMLEDTFYRLTQWQEEEVSQLLKKCKTQELGWRHWILRGFTTRSV